MSDSMDANIKRLWFLVNTVGSTMERAALLSLTDALGDQRGEERERWDDLRRDIGNGYQPMDCLTIRGALNIIDLHAPPTEEPADAD